MDRGGHKVVPQGIHGQQGRHAYGIPEVITEYSAGEFRARGGLAGNTTNGFSLFQIESQEGESQTGEVGSPSKRCNNYIWQISGFFHLFYGLLADDGLVQLYMIKYTAQGIFGLRVAVSAKALCYIQPFS